MEARTSAAARHESAAIAPIFAPIAKIDEEQRMVFGYATTETRDQQGEIVRLAAIREALPEYMKWRNVREMHQAKAVGVAVEAQVDDKGLWFGAHVVDEEAWAKVKAKVYKGFSIGGRVTDRDPKDRSTITGLELTEVSLVDRPANPDAVYTVVKRNADGVLCEQPLQKWDCGDATHQHRAKVEASACMQKRAVELQAKAAKLALAAAQVRSAADEASAIVKGFNEDQPRDERGRWSSGGEGPNGGTLVVHAGGQSVDGKGAEWGVEEHVRVPDDVSRSDYGSGGQRGMVSYRQGLQSSSGLVAGANIENANGRFVVLHHAGGIENSGAEAQHAAARFLADQNQSEKAYAATRTATALEEKARSEGGKANFAAAHAAHVQAAHEHTVAWMQHRGRPGADHAKWYGHESYALSHEKAAATLARRAGVKKADGTDYPDAIEKAGVEDEPRDDHGRWTSGGGAGSEPVEPHDALAASREANASSERASAYSAQTKGGNELDHRIAAEHHEVAAFMHQRAASMVTSVPAEKSKGLPDVSSHRAAAAEHKVSSRFHDGAADAHMASGGVHVPADEASARSHDARASSYDSQGDRGAAAYERGAAHAWRSYKAEKGFNPDQSRDDHGRWSGDGSTEVSHEGATYRLEPGMHLMEVQPGTTFLGTTYLSPQKLTVSSGYKEILESRGAKLIASNNNDPTKFRKGNVDDEARDERGRWTTGGGQSIPSRDSQTYQEREKRPGWNITVKPGTDAREGGRMLRQRLPGWSKEDHEDAARAHMAAANDHRIAWGREQEKAHMERFGTKPSFHDYRISGIGRDEYSDKAKNALREHAHASSEHADLAQAHWRAAGHRGYITKVAVFADLFRNLRPEIVELAGLAKAFNPDQERDDHGRWTTEGGSDSQDGRSAKLASRIALTADDYAMTHGAAEARHMEASEAHQRAARYATSAEDREHHQDAADFHRGAQDAHSGIGGGVGRTRAGEIATAHAAKAAAAKAKGNATDANYYAGSAHVYGSYGKVPPVYKAFNADQARDEHGRWSAEGMSELGAERAQGHASGMGEGQAKTLAREHREMADKLRQTGHPEAAAYHDAHATVYSQVAHGEPAIPDVVGHLTGATAGDRGSAKGEYNPSKDHADHESHNSGWGYYGTMRDHERGDRQDERAMSERSESADTKFDHARIAVEERFGVSSADAREFLDSRWGRHMADSVIGSGRSPREELHTRSWDRPFKEWQRAGKALDSADLKKAEGRLTRSHILKAFNPDQPRGKDGKWVEGAADRSEEFKNAPPTTYGERVRELEEKEEMTTSDAQGVADVEHDSGREFRYDPRAPLDPHGGLSRFDYSGDAKLSGGMKGHVTEHEDEKLRLSELEQKRDSFIEAHEHDNAAETQRTIAQRESAYASYQSAAASGKGFDGHNRAAGAHQGAAMEYGKAEDLYRQAGDKVNADAMRARGIAHVNIASMHSGVMRRATKLLEKGFDPDEARDGSGKWTGGAGGSDAAHDARDRYKDDKVPGRWGTGAFGSSEDAQKSTANARSSKTAESHKAAEEAHYAAANTHDRIQQRADASGDHKAAHAAANAREKHLIAASLHHIKAHDMTHKAFDPDQARDDNGRWAAANEAATTASNRADRASLAAGSKEQHLRAAKAQDKAAEAHRAAAALATNDKDRKHNDGYGRAATSAADRHRELAGVEHARSFEHEGKSYYHTGKEGTVAATGEKSAEYEHVVNGNKTGARVWRTLGGRIVPEMTGKAFNPDQERDDHGRWAAEAGDARANALEHERMSGAHELAGGKDHQVAAWRHDDAANFYSRAAEQYDKGNPDRAQQHLERAKEVGQTARGLSDKLGVKGGDGAKIGAHRGWDIHLDDQGKYWALRQGSQRPAGLTGSNLAGIKSRVDQIENEVASLKGKAAPAVDLAKALPPLGADGKFSTHARMAAAAHKDRARHDRQAARARDGERVHRAAAERALTSSRDAAMVAHHQQAAGTMAALAEQHDRAASQYQDLAARHEQAIRKSSIGDQP